MYKNLINKIKEYQNIVIYRHQRPDGDAVFSQFAMYEFLKLNFSKKDIRMYARSEYDLLPYKNSVDLKFINNSLAIVLDTATSKRCDDETFKQAKYIIKIDHHPETDKYGIINIVDEKAAATCEILANMFASKEFSKFKFNDAIYRYLYCGILTDSNSFRTSSTTANTLNMASVLARKGKLDVAALSNYVFDKSLSDFNKETKLRTFLKTKNGVGYVICNKKTLHELKMTHDDVKNAIDEFNSIKGLKIWAVFAYNSKTKLYDASLRSKKKYVINKLCASYNGGGHKNACGIKDLSLKDVKQIVLALQHIAN